MRRFVLLCAAVIAFGHSASQAATIGFDADGGGDSFTPISAFDYLPGNALADGGTEAIDVFLETGQSTAFDVYYHARLAQVVRPDGSTFDPADEYTVVLGFREVVTGVGQIGGQNIATFDFAAGPSFLEIYHDPSNNADDLTGTGFNDGTLVLSGEVVAGTGLFSVTQTSAVALDQFNTNNYPGIQTRVGSGTADVTASVTFVNPDYFNLPSPFEIQFTLFHSDQATPFRNVDPSARFYKAPGGAPPVLDGAGTPLVSIGIINGDDPDAQGGPDFQFETDSRQTFTVIPEPTSMTLLGIGAFGFGLAGIRRRRSVETQA